MTRAKLAYDKAKLDYENQVSYSNVTSPISGMIESCDIEVFDKVSASTQLYVISGAGNKILSTALTENLKDRVYVGEEIQAEKSGSFYTGTIYEISSMADPATGLYKMKCRMEEENPFSTGAAVKMTFVSERAEDVMVIPVDTVRYDNGMPYVFTYDDGIVHKVFVETGIYDADRMEIQSGIDWDTEIINTWNSELYEGASVIKMQEEAQEAVK